MRTRTRNASGATLRDETPVSKVPVPLRVIAGRAPSGGEIRLLKWQESQHPSVSWYQGCLTEAEDAQFWKAKLLAEKQGITKWNEARALLIAAGWSIQQESAT